MNSGRSSTGPIGERQILDRVAFGLLVGFMVLALIATLAEFSSFEYKVFNAINSLPEAMFPLWAVVTYFGSVYSAVIAAGVALAIRRRWLALQLLATSFIGTLLVSIIKHLVDRPRPGVIFQNIYNPIAESGLGFPSGHTTQATVLAVLLALYFGGIWRVVAVLWIVAVGLSRMYLGVHGPLDIIGGIVLGSLVAIMTYRWAPFIHKKLVTKS